MKITHINYSDANGGAALAALRLHKGLIDKGVDSEMLVRWKRSSVPEVRAIQCRSNITAKLFRWLDRRRSDSLHNYANNHEIEILSDARAVYTDDLLKNIPKDTDVLHLHWVRGLVDYNRFLRVASQRWPIVWTLHDLNPILGCTHFPESRFPEAPVGCEQPADLHAWSRKILKRKAIVYDGVEASRLTFACPCAWVDDMVKSSPVLKKFTSKVVHYGVCSDTFQPYDKRTARAYLGIDDDAFVVATSALYFKQSRKGLHLLAQALEGSPPDWQLLVLGPLPDQSLAGLPMPVVGAGKLKHGGEVAAMLAAADVFVLPSLYETGPATVMEAMACELPVIATSVGDVPEMINSPDHGYCVKPDPKMIRTKLEELYHNPELREAMGKCARSKIISSHSVRREVMDYMKLYDEVINR